MARIKPLPQDQWSPEFKARADASPHEMLAAGVMAHVPDLAKAMGGLQYALAKKTFIPARMQELVRLRIAFHNQCRSCMAVRYKTAVDAGVDEDLVCSLEKPMEAPNLTAEEKAALAYADKFATNHFAIDDSDFDALRVYFSEKQIIELCMFIAFATGFGRFGATMDMVDELPDAYKDKGADIVAPWKNESLLMPG
jgi:AhpD family alkylhydroperoxidase